MATSVAGPFATQILGDLGADVIKVERPGDGDHARGWGPPFWNGESAVFLSLNRNKKSLVLDLKRDGDRDTFRRLLNTADIFVQNLRPGAIAKLGFGHEEVRKAHPRLIYCDISGYGPEGPLADRPAYDPLMQAFSGLMSITGEPGRPPVRIPVSILDQGTGLWAAIAILDALRIREDSGEGSYVHASLLQTALMWQPFQLTGYFATGEVPGRLGSAAVGIAPYEAFATEDGYIVISAGNEASWRRLCDAVDRPDLLDDERFKDNKRRVENREALADELSETLRRCTTALWLERLSEKSVPASPIQTFAEVVNHEQVRAIGSLAAFPHPRIDGFRIINAPIERNGAYPAIRLLPPLLGEHSDEILRSLEG